jgi:hypothetical protein
MLFTRKLNKRHQPVGKPVLSGFLIEFSQAMNPATAGDAGNYQVDWVSLKHVNGKTVKVLHPVPVSERYDPASHSSSVLLSSQQAFAQGGQITVLAAGPNGVSSASGASLDGNNQGTGGDNGVFTVLPNGRGVTR